MNLSKITITYISVTLNRFSAWQRQKEEEEEEEEVSSTGIWHALTAIILLVFPRKSIELSTTHIIIKHTEREITMEPYET